jgi:hypothetical protein
MYRPDLLRASLLAALMAALPRVSASAQDGVPERPVRDVPAAPKRAFATRLGGVAPRMDGRLDDAVWAQARWFSDFVQKEPVEGAAPTERTEVGILYDDEAIYVGARMYAADPAAIQRVVGRRDVNGGLSEHIWISFDSYRDRRTAYSFGVTASGVRIDWYHPVDHEYRIDMSFDPVWDARAVVDSLGWTAELRIPFSQLRYRPDSVQQWGMNVDRWIPSRNEDVFWVPVPRNEVGWSSRMGDLVGIEGIRPPRRIELIPYTAANAVVATAPDAADPFDPDGRTAEARVGGDLKMGLGPNLTLEATVNPDFGQVEADPAVVNLSQFEVTFEERRPFFIEGSQLLRGDGPSYFYSRRIGAAPRGSADGDYVDRPTATTILTAAKLTGRLASGLSIGALGAVTGEEYARTYDAETGTHGSTPIAPLAGYGVMRLRQEFGPNASTVGAMVTAVRRDAAPGTPLGELLARQAVAGGVDWNLRFGRGMYEVNGFAGLSHVEGDSAAIDLLQRSSARYYQRPDQSYVTYDPSRRSLTGYTGLVGIRRNAGAHWLWNASVATESPGLELNDAGRMQTADGTSAQGSLTYREVRPSPRFRTWNVDLGASSEWSYGGVRQGTSASAEAEATWANNWSSSVVVRRGFGGLDERMTRGGPLMARLPSWGMSASLRSNFAATNQWRVGASGSRGDDGGWGASVSGGVTVRPGPRWTLALAPSLSWGTNTRQWVATVEDTAATDTYGARYVFAAVEQRQVSMQVRFNYAFAPDLTLEVYAEPFVASGRYRDWGELPAPRAGDLRVYGEAPGTSLVRNADGSVTVTDGAASFTIANEGFNSDYNVTSFRSNAVLRWEWRRGSTLYLVWQTDRGDDALRTDPARAADLFQGLHGEGTSFFAVKVSYWISVN